MPREATTGQWVSFNPLERLQHFFPHKTCLTLSDRQQRLRLLCSHRAGEKYWRHWLKKRGGNETRLNDVDRMNQCSFKS